MTLRQDIESWDTRSAEAIAGVYDAHVGTRGFLGRLITLSGEPPCEVGATWLIKRHLEGGAQMTSQQAARWYALAPGLVRWEARLHLLQSAQWVPVPTGDARRTEAWLSRCLTEDRPFVRAWALDAYASLARTHPRYRERALEMLEDGAANDPSASVRARARQALKEGGLTP